ncbi:MmgE/PrpD family protein [Candidatus Bathyarchaeota archaeon]|jgi:2-methylcitrate dehydratase PrpD|nr:MmgE/PrpD family protein [Candidatus Bathyarchaeota archaeon]MBT4320623.1 MmgE/PrpD family protein [Candidatus Bathyarchaeota archaeon]MBT4424120.1 MmgE/PrpD family protein [Candidatus Bathyarchaeota archaeon]MBT7188112.1 MmgE/PrpD family protein [Candidatus Bathyarchaeota archaeon]MBT7346016.1 MmgE/PrpD family protein [Candidatus Bathyarchaeota archaeon]
MDEYSRIFAKYVVDLNYDELPAEVIKKTKMHFLDYLGNTFAAHEMPWSQMVISIVKQMKGEPQSTVIGEGKYPMMNAALANGTMAHGVDADDSGARPSWAHPGACINPAAFAAAETEGVSGKKLITGILAGYEISCRVDSSMYPGLRDRGFHATGVVGTIGATAAAGKILGLNEDQMVNAFGLAGTQAAGLEEWLTTGDMSKRLHAGKAAMNGVLAALLAREGYTGPSSVFAGKHGLLTTHSESYDTNRLTDGLGTEYKILGCKFKPYACCHELCPPIRMALQLREEHDIKPDDVKKIRIGLNHITAENQLKVAKTPLHAQNQPAVAVGIALVEGKVFLKEFFECYEDSTVIELGKKTEVYTDPEIDAVFPTKIGTRLEIITKDNHYALFEEDKPPIPSSFIQEKFTALATMLVSEETAEKIIQAVNRLEQIEDLGQLSNLI